MIDFHAHLDLYPNPQEIVRECIARDLCVLSVTTTPSAWEGTSVLAASGSRVINALGLHPQIAHLRKGELEIFDAILPKTQFVGEIGLDGAPEFMPHWDDQLLVFKHILLACAHAGGKIMSIHSRRASSVILDMVELFPKAGAFVLHWFSGNKNELERAISLDCWFSVGVPMLSSAKGLDLVRNIPHGRILTETDGPFTKHLGRNAVPWDVQQSVIQLAALWGRSFNEVENDLDKNLLSLTSHY